MTLTAKPAAGCVFDHFEVKASASSGDWIGFNGSTYDYPTVTISIYNEETITLTTAIDKSYTVRGVFKIYDTTPADLKVTVKLELECTNDVSGWNNDIIPVDLVDSAGVEHHWSASRNDLQRRKGHPHVRSRDCFTHLGTCLSQFRRRIYLPRLRTPGSYLGQRLRQRHGKPGSHDQLLSVHNVIARRQLHGYLL